MSPTALYRVTVVNADAASGAGSRKRAALSATTDATSTASVARS